MPATAGEDDWGECPLFAPEGAEIPRVPPEGTAEHLPAAVGALAHLLYDEESGDERAELVRARANDLMKRGKLDKTFLKLAIEKYSEAIAIKCESPEVAAAGYANRAEAHLRLGNYGHALTDSEAAIQIQSDHVKARYRAAYAALMIGKYSLASRHCEQALASGAAPPPQVATFRSLLRRVAEGAAKEAAAAQARQLRKATVQAREATLSTALAARGVTMGLPLFAQQRRYSVTEPSLEPEGELSWPVLVVYPEGVNEGVGMQSDFLERVHEDTTMRDIVQLLFPPDAPPAPWDVGRVYWTGTRLEVLYRREWTWRLDEVEEEERAERVGSLRGPEEVGEWVSVDMDLSVKDLVGKKDYVTPLFPVIYLVPRNFVPP